MKKHLTFVFTILVFATSAQKGEWVNLFDGKTTNGWHNWHKTSVSGWQVMDGVLMTNGGNGDIVTDKEYENFELEFDFKVSPKGNSGVFYKVIERDDLKNTYDSGPEYQVIDDMGYPKKIKNSQKTAANYDIHPINDFTVVKPAGEWNKGKIIVNGSHVEHWLNGKKMVEYEYGTKDWMRKVAKSKFAKMEYAKPHAKGKIALQDHNDAVSFCNIKIKEL